MRFFKFIKKILGLKKVEVEMPNEAVDETVETVVEPKVEKAEVEKMTERLKDVTTSKPLSRIEPTEEVVTVKEIKSKSKKKEEVKPTEVKKTKAKKSVAKKADKKGQ